MVGQQIACPACASTITIPAPVAEAPAVSATPAAPLQSVEIKPARRAPIFAAAAVLVFLLIGGTGWYLFGKSATGEKKGSPAGHLLGFFKRADLAEVKVFPPNVDLKTKQDRQSVVVQAIYADGVTRDVTAQSAFVFGNKALVRMEHNTIFPVTDGQTDLQVKFEGRTLTVPVTIAEAKVERPISFKMDVMPVFMKAGCNTGGCHGSSRGKDGFRLSLFGYDPDGDYFR